MSDEPYPPPTPHTSLLPSYSTHRVAQMGYPKVDRDKLFRARAIVVVTLFINVACLLFGTLVSPSIQSVARENHYAFSPNPWFIIAFFAAHVVLQLWWILRLFHATEDTAARLDALSYVPIYALGSIALAGWALLWTHGHFALAFALAALNFGAHLHPLATLPLATRANLSTHLVAKTFAGLALMLFLDTGAAALGLRAPPSTLVVALAGVLFGISCLTTDPIFGACLVYDLVGLVVGQHKPWRGDLVWMTIAVGAVVLVKFAVYRVY